MSQQRELITKRIGDYGFHLNDIIGEGYSSKVYKGYNIATNIPVAIKVISSENYQSPIQKSLLNNEIKILLQIDHSNLLKVYEISQSVNNTYIVSEFCEGGTLEKMMEKGKLTTDQVFLILKQISKGLIGLHEKNIIHRDIKPANILIKDGVYKLADFGFALIEDQFDSIIKKYNVGTPMYMAPEIQLFNQYSEKTDVWALGIMLYEMLFNRIPNFKLSYEGLLQDIKLKCKTLEIQYQSQLFQLFEGMLQLEPDDRISNQQVLNILMQDNWQINKNSPLVKLSQKSISTQMNSPLQSKTQIPKTPAELRKKYQQQLLSNKKPLSYDSQQFAAIKRIKTAQLNVEVSSDDEGNNHALKSYRECPSYHRKDSDAKIEYLGQISTDCSLQQVLSIQKTEGHNIQLPAIIRPTYKFCQFLEQIIIECPNEDEPLMQKLYFLFRKLLAIKAKVFYTFAPVQVKDQLNKWMNYLKDRYCIIQHLINLNFDKTFQLFFNPNLDDQGKLLMMYIISLANQMPEQSSNILTIVNILQDNLQQQNDPFLFARKWAQNQ